MASTTRNIFTLGEYNDATIEGDGVPLPSVWYGDTRFIDGRVKLNSNMYFTGGNGNQPGFPGSFPERTSYADKIVITTDTNSSVPSAQPPIPIGGDDGFNTPSTTISYYSGYQRSRVYKLTYATEAQSSSPTGTFVQGPSMTSNEYVHMTAVGNDTVGYFAGGDANPADTSQIQKITFSEETFAILPATGNQPGRRNRQTATGIPTRGYFVAGLTGSSATSSVTRMEYSTDTTTAIPNANEAYFSRGSTGTDIAGYFTGGTAGPHNGFTGGENPSEKLVYSTETFTATPTLYGNYQYGLPSYWGPGERRGVAGSGSKETGYWAGGLYPAPGTAGDMRSWVDKIDFATETASRRATNIQNARAVGQMGTGPRKNALATFDPPTPTPTSPTTLTGPEGIKAEGYLIQGIHGSISGSGRSDSYRLDYSTDTWSPSANSPITRKGAGATSTTTNTYVAGGTMLNVDGSPHGGDLDKFTYATSTFSRIPGTDAGGPSGVAGPGTAPKQSAAGNQTQGYWAFNQGGGQSRCSKLTYSSETGSNLPNLPWNAKNAVGVSKQTEGYYGSGDGFDDAGSRFLKITFSSDTYSSYNGWSSTGPGPAPNRAGTSSSTKAYIVGGSPNEIRRYMDVTPWATNTTSNSPSTFLQSPAGFAYTPGQGSNEAGYFTGHYQSRTEKITYSSDTSALVPSAYFPSSSPSGVNSYSTGGPNMNGLGTNTPNIV